MARQDKKPPLQVLITTKLSQEIAAAKSLDELYQRVVDEVKESFGYYYVQLLRYDLNHDSLQLVAGYGEIGTQMLECEPMMPVAKGTSGKAASSGKTEIRTDLTKDPDWHPDPLLPETQSEIAVPIKVGETVWGVIDIFRNADNALDSAEQLLLEGICAQVAIAIQNRQSQELLNKRVRELNCLSEIGHRIDERPSLSDFLYWVSEKIPDAMQFPEICVSAITIGQDIYGDPSTLTLPRKIVAGIRVGGQLIGQVHIAYKQEKYFLDEESAFIGAVVGRVSSYIESLKLLDQLQNRSEELAILNEMGRALAAVMDTESICAILYQYTQQLMEVPSFFVALYDEITQMLQMPLVYSQGKRVEVAPRQLGNALTDHIIRTAQPLLISDQLEERIAELGVELRLIANTKPAESWLGVPIIYGGHVLGAIVVQSITTPGLYGETERDLLTAIANQAASTIENSHSFEKSRRQTQDLAVLNELGRTLTQLQDENQILETTYRFCGQLMDVTNFSVLFYDADRDLATFPFVTVNGLPVETSPAPLRRGLPYQIIHSREPVLLSEHVMEQVQELGLETETGKDEEIPLSWLGVPLSYGEMVIGVISVQSITTSNLYTERERDLLVAISSQTAIALENSRSFNNSRQRSEELIILNEMGRSLGLSTDLETLSRTICNYTGKLMDATNFFIGIYDQKLQLIHFPLAVVDGAEIEAPSRELGKGLSDYILRTHNALLLNNNVTDQMKELGIEFVLLGNATPAVSWLGVPILYAEEILGVIGLQSVTTPWLYTDTHKDLLSSIANQAAIALKNLYQYQETQKALEDQARQAAELATVAEVSTFSTSVLDVDRMLEQVVQHTQQGFHLYHCHVFLLDSETNELRIVACGWEAGSPYFGTHEAKSIPLNQEQSLVARAARTRQVVIANDVRTFLGWLPNPQLPDTASEIAVPMMVGDRILGVFDVQASEISRFTENDVRVQVTLASQIAIAVQNAHQFRQTQTALSQAEALYTATDQLVRTKNIQEVLEVLVQSTSLRTADRATILTFDQFWEVAPPSFYRVEAAWERSGGNPIIAVGTTLTRAQVAFETYLQRDNPTYISDTRTDQRLNTALRSSFQQQGIQSMIAFPIVASGHWIGLLLTHSSGQLTVEESDLRQINLMAGQAATVIESLRLHQDLENRLKELLSLQRSVTRDYWSSYLNNRGRADWGYLYDRVGLKDQAMTITEQDYTRPVVIRDLEIGRLGIRADSTSRESLDEDERAIVASVADQLSQALERARLLEQTQKSAVELQSVAQVSSATSTILDPTELLQSVVDLARNSFGLYHAHAYLLDSSRSAMVLAAGAGEVGRSMVKEGWSILMEEDTIVTRAAKTHEGQIVNDVRQSPNFLPNPSLPDTSAEMAIPMIVGQQVLGVFDVQSAKTNAFSIEDLRTFTTLASQTAVALQNARLFAEQADTVEKLRELDHLKSTFLANMSHELRTPLNSILGFAQVILEGIDGPLTDYMTTDLQLIEKNGKHLLYLINEILDMAKIESGRLTLSLEDIDLRTLMADVFETTSSQARDRLLYLQLDDDPKADLVLKADQLRLRQVLLNLTSNAIKFTEAGGLTVIVRRKQEMIEMQFKDTGIGIPSDKLEMIFEAFSQVDTSTTRKVGGTGLGLPISRRLIELHGGKLWAESSGISGEGSTFHVRLPIKGPEGS